MIVLNADGSRPEMCGNGLRCVVAYLNAQRPATGGVYRVETDAGVLSCRVEDGAGGATVAVEMGPARYGSEVIALDTSVAERSGEGPEARWRLAGSPWWFVPVSMGNPHAVVLVDAETSPESLARREGPVLGASRAFLEGVNVGWARSAGDGVVELAVHERGVGPTLACGTGACAAAAALYRGEFERKVKVRQPGGEVTVTLGEPAANDQWQTGVVEMSGPARLVFRGELAMRWWDE